MNATNNERPPADSDSPEVDLARALVSGDIASAEAAFERLATSIAGDLLKGAMNSDNAEAAAYDRLAEALLGAMTATIASALKNNTPRTLQ
jgi:hypothetical protein